jgi:alpha/beta superfamily hydrolase
VRAALDECARRYPTLPLLVGGFSFGSVMAQRVGVDERVRASFALGFPVRSVSDASFLDGVRKPRLFVQGENDVFGDGAAIRALVEPLVARPTLVVVPGSDHYFNGHLEPMQAALSAWMDGRPWA